MISGLTAPRGVVGEMMMGDALGDRMKVYEKSARTTLPRRMPVIVRVDGKAFHTYTRGCDRPFDEALMNALKCANRVIKQARDAIDAGAMSAADAREMRDRLAAWDASLKAVPRD